MIGQIKWDRRGLFGAVLEAERCDLRTWVRLRASKPHSRMVRWMDVWPHDDGARHPMLIVDLCRPLIRGRT